MKSAIFSGKPLCFFLLWACLLPAASFAQDTLWQKNEVFYTYPRQFALRLVYQERKLPLELQPLNSDKRAAFQPNSSRNLGVGGTFFGISYTVSFQLPASLQRDQDLYGSTKQRDLRLNAYLKQWGLILDRQDYTGYYLNNIEELDPDWQTGNELPLRNDLRVKRFGVGVSYLLQPDRFSYSGALNNKRRQHKSGGTFFLQAYGGRLSISGDSVLLPRKSFADAGRAATVEDVSLYHGSLMPGYAHTFVLGKFYLMTSLALGPEVQKRSFSEQAAAGDARTNKELWAVEGRLQMQAAFGYDNHTYFWNIAYNNQYQQYEVDGLGIGINTNGYRLLVGRRFKEMRFMRKVRNWGIYKKLRGDE